MADRDQMDPVAQNQDINQAQVVQGADGAIASKVEKTKLPEFMIRSF